jgi:hypothetical protein
VNVTAGGAFEQPLRAAGPQLLKITLSRSFRLSSVHLLFAKLTSSERAYISVDWDKQSALWDVGFHKQFIISEIRTAPRP